MSLFRSLKGSWYLGKGSRALKCGRYDQALRYLLFAHEYAQEAGNAGELAVRREAIAETYLKLEDFDKARQYACESLEIYKSFYSKNQVTVFKEAINRVSRFLNEITFKEKENKQSNSDV